MGGSLEGNMSKEVMSSQQNKQWICVTCFREVLNNIINRCPV